MKLPSAEVRAALSGLRRVVRALRQSSTSAERELGVSAAQLFVLHELSLRPGISVTDLARSTMTDQSSVSVVAQRLVARGLITRHRAPDDGRRAVLVLTHAGARLVRDGPEPVQLRLIRALRDLGKSEARTLGRVLEHVAEELGAEEEPPMFFEDGEVKKRSRKNTPKKRRLRART